MKDPCEHCGDAGCLSDDRDRPSSHHIDGIEFSTCGRYLPAGEYVAVQRGKYGFAFCRKCFWGALKAGVSEDRFNDGDLAHCIPCGYHTARLKGTA